VLQRVYDANGETVALGREIARGGEGAIRETEHDANVVAKLYLRRVESEKALKLRSMVRKATPDLLRVAAWPTMTLHDNPGGQLIGVLMPKVPDHREIHQLYSPAQRKAQFPKADWKFLIHVAMNCAAAFETVHHCGHIIGDVNQSGVLVSNQGTVHLIDCDSFQIRDNGRVFYCEVGVPQFTPPELQGRAFRGIERTQQHDCFGLAILVFQLLFMGRHPFAGRFLGTGDMPIDKAIEESRFAFSKLATSLEMAPPPNSLSMDALPSAITTLFDRAFIKQRSATARPSATEWRQAMMALKASLKQCQTDPGHRFLGSLLQCPWCNIVDHGGPNFFISVQLYISGAQADLPPFDVEKLWQRIEAIPRPAYERPKIPPAAEPARPTPLPEGMQDQRLLLFYCRVVTVSSCLITLLGTMTLRPVVYIGIALASVFGLGWIILTLVSSFKKEMNRRVAEASAKRQMLEQAQTQWDTLADYCPIRFDAIRIDLMNVKSDAIGISAKFAKEREQLEHNRRLEQLEEFLDGHLIRDSPIHGIGPGRLASLLSFGIETAADTPRIQDLRIPGIGPAIKDELTQWRYKLICEFRFDPNRSLPTSQLQMLVAKFRAAQKQCESRLLVGEEELTHLIERSRIELNAIGERIQKLVAEVRQADADLRAK